MKWQLCHEWFIFSWYSSPITESPILTTIYFFPDNYEQFPILCTTILYFKDSISFLSSSYLFFSYLILFYSLDYLIFSYLILSYLILFYSIDYCFCFSVSIAYIVAHNFLIFFLVLYCLYCHTLSLYVLSCLVLLCWVMSCFVLLWDVLLVMPHPVWCFMSSFSIWTRYISLNWKLLKLVREEKEEE